MHSTIDGKVTADCPGREILSHLASRWGFLTMLALQDGPQRFHVLRDRIDSCSEKMLSQTLAALVRDGFVSRSVEPSNPPRVTYELTDLGAETAPLLRQLSTWIGAHITDIASAQQRFDAIG